MSKGKVYVIAGATASGKTAIGVKLAKKLNGEVISADSMQVYKYMNIGTAKPTEDEKEGIVHHLLDVINPNEGFSVAEYQKLATLAINEIIKKGKTPILVGGTGFYINAVLYDTEFSHDIHEDEVNMREKYIKLALVNGAEWVYEKLKNVDPEYSNIIHANNIKRVARALAYCKITGKKFSEHNALQKEKKPVYDTMFCILNMNRELLYDRINKRTLLMFENGLEDEVRDLLSKGYDKNLTAMQAIGYKETLKFISGEIKFDEAVEDIQKSTRNYAKRQETWFRNQVKSAIKINVNNNSATSVAEYLAKHEVLPGTK